MTRARPKPSSLISSGRIITTSEAPEPSFRLVRRARMPYALYLCHVFAHVFGSRLVADSQVTHMNFLSYRCFKLLNMCLLRLSVLFASLYVCMSSCPFAHVRPLSPPPSLRSDSKTLLKSGTKSDGFLIFLPAPEMDAFSLTCLTKGPPHICARPMRGTSRLSYTNTYRNTRLNVQPES